MVERQTALTLSAAPATSRQAIATAQRLGQPQHARSPAPQISTATRHGFRPSHSRFAPAIRVEKAATTAPDTSAA